MAIAFTKRAASMKRFATTGVRWSLDGSLAGAHYGLAFLLLQRGDPDGAAQHAEDVPRPSAPWTRRTEMDRARDPGAPTTLAPPLRPEGSRRARPKRGLAATDSEISRCSRSRRGGGGGGARLQNQHRSEPSPWRSKSCCPTAPGSRSPTRSAARPPAQRPGDSVQAQLYWSSLDTTLTVLDSATGVSLANAVGTARVQARTAACSPIPRS